jgi:hypothetical protein
MNGSPWFRAGDGTAVPRLLSSLEAAELLGISDSAVRGLCRRGRSLPGAFRFANQWLVPVRAVELRIRARGEVLTAARVREVVGDPPRSELRRLEA